MKLFALTAFLAMTATASGAEIANPTTMGWREYSEARGCVWVDKGGYFNLALASDPTDPCPDAVRTAFFGKGSRLVDPDGVPGNGDEYMVSDN